MTELPDNDILLNMQSERQRLIPSDFVYRQNELRRAQQLMEAAVVARPVHTPRPAVRMEPVPASNIILSVERENHAAFEDFQTRQLRAEVLNGHGVVANLMQSYYLTLGRLGQKVALSFGASVSERQRLSSKLQEALAEIGGTGSIIDIDAPSISSLIWLYPRYGVVRLQREGTYRTFQFQGGSQRYYYEVGETFGGPGITQPGKLVRLVLESKVPSVRHGHEFPDLPRRG